MHTVAEIKAAIEKLSAKQIEELVHRLDEQQAMLTAADSVFVMLDREESAHDQAKRIFGD